MCQHLLSITRPHSAAAELSSVCRGSEEALSYSWTIRAELTAPSSLAGQAQQQEAQPKAAHSSQQPQFEPSSLNLG